MKCQSHPDLGTALHAIASQCISNVTKPGESLALAGTVLALLGPRHSLARCFCPAPTLISIMFCFPFSNRPGYYSNISHEALSSSTQLRKCSRQTRLADIPSQAVIYLRPSDTSQVRAFSGLSPRWASPSSNKIIIN